MKFPLWKYEQLVFPHKMNVQLPCLVQNSWQDDMQKLQSEQKLLDAELQDGCVARVSANQGKTNSKDRDGPSNAGTLANTRI